MDKPQTTPTWIRMQDGTPQSLSLRTNSDTRHFINYLREHDHPTDAISTDAIGVSVAVCGHDNIGDQALQDIQLKLDEAYYRGQGDTRIEMTGWALDGVFP